MSQPTPIDISTPSGEAWADRALHEEIRRYLGREEVVNTIMLSGFTACDRFDPAQPVLAARSVDPPNGVPGRWRPIEPADQPLLVEWFTDFVIEAEHVAPDKAKARGQGMIDRLDERSGGLLWLDDDGAPVSIACYKLPTPNGIRISSVYTPPEQRRRGFAAAVTAATTQLMFDRGHAFACLYTDASNATANHVYESIGYQFVADSMQYRFTETPE